MGTKRVFTDGVGAPDAVTACLAYSGSGPQVAKYFQSGAAMSDCLKCPLWSSQENFLPAEQGGAQVFGVVEVRLLQAPDARGQKAVGQVVGSARVARNVQEALPRAAAKARFFQQFAACGLLGRFALFADAAQSS